ncbi:hypothetical protein [Salarchaeum sp. JOR-1]|uniref:hypothetical protein n=1 Tax=Salarchaeum sp. JOR-1 TaxID=2599399 RepID=UPI00119880B4|nr:hypothetical protein [Salarchaeum sp. JOR-1]QDX39995.1 hypothetical protein FQU85_03445 [Salarchaeum sp. JOR-1]
MTPHLTRRHLLGALGASGAAVLAGRSVLARDRTPPYQHYTYAQSDGGAFRVAWYEEYNGRVLSASNGTTRESALDSAAGYVDDPASPVVGVTNALPGDYGSAVFGLLAEDVPLDVWLRVRATADAAAPEPDETDASANLEDVTDVSVSLDSCTGGLSGEYAYVAGGTLHGVADALAAGVRLEFDGATGCPGALPIGQPRCVTFDWALATAAGNGAMGDSVTFDVEFVGADCTAGVANPWGDG